MGARLLRSWLLRPSVRRGEIEARLSARRRPAPLADAPRPHAHASQRGLRPRTPRRAHQHGHGHARATSSPSAVRSIKSRRSARPYRTRRRRCSRSSSRTRTSCPTCATSSRARSATTRPPTSRTAASIREGFDAELDELRSVSRDAKQTIAAIESRERTRSGISSLRVRFNNVFGYFIEVSKAIAARVPADYERRQTLANAERYTTPELKEWEQKVLGAEDRILEIETRIFGEIRAQVAAETRRLQATARALAMLDVLASLAEVAARRRYHRPALHDGDELEIKAGRHPVIEAIGDEPFIPNDLYMNNSTDRLLIITGPNMGGKSTLLGRRRSSAFWRRWARSSRPRARACPCSTASGRASAPRDDLARGRSTFMVEMTETAAILHNATPRSLVLLDEIGRGTATFDGLSIAWAVAEHLHDSAEHAAKTLFATHYHELTELAERLPGAQNYQIRVAEREGEVIFLYKLERGRASKSYGIEVARLAGLPPSVLARAREVLSKLERYELDVFAEEGARGAAAGVSARGLPRPTPARTEMDALGRAATRARAPCARRAGHALRLDQPEPP